MAQVPEQGQQKVLLPPVCERRERAQDLTVVNLSETLPEGGGKGEGCQVGKQWIVIIVVNEYL